MNEVRSTQPIVAVVGPTASGKSDLGLALAERFNGEIINCDSVQVYRDIYIATAKVPIEEQRGIPHYLMDIAEPTENFTAVAWAEKAREVISDIEARGKTPFLVGGTGFYLRALTKKIFEAPSIDPSLRPRLMEILNTKSSEHLHRILKRKDLESARKIAPNDRSRIVRALEVYFSCGTPLSTLQSNDPEEVTEYDERLHYFVLQPPREELYERINLRVDIMVKAGLLDEIKNLVAQGVPYDAKAFNAHGYKRFVEYLQGQRSFESAVEQMKLDTRHYAKRQWTWWRAKKNTHWFDGFGFEDGIIDQACEIYMTLKK